MSAFEPLTIQQFTVLTPKALDDYTINLSSAILTAKGTEGYTYECLTASELLLLSPSELYTYSINLSTLQANELKTQALIDSLSDVKTFIVKQSESTIQGISSMSYANTLVQASASDFASSSQLLYAASASTVAGIEAEIAAADAQIAIQDSTIAVAESTIKASNNIIEAEIAQTAFSESTISTTNAINAANTKRANYYSTLAGNTSALLQTVSSQIVVANATSIEAATNYMRTQQQVMEDTATAQAAYYTASVNANISAQSDITLQIASQLVMRGAYGFKQAALIDETESRRAVTKTFTSSTDPLYISSLSSVTRIQPYISTCNTLTDLYLNIIPNIERLSTVFIDRTSVSLPIDDIKNQIEIATITIEKKQRDIKSIVIPILSERDMKAASDAVTAKEAEYEAALGPDMDRIEQELNALNTVYQSAYDAYTNSKLAYDAANLEIDTLNKEIEGLNATILSLTEEITEKSSNLAVYDISVSDFRTKISSLQTNIKATQTIIDAGIIQEIPLATQQTLNANISTVIGSFLATAPGTIIE